VDPHGARATGGAPASDRRPGDQRRRGAPPDRREEPGRCGKGDSGNGTRPGGGEEGRARGGCCSPGTA
jgi:hypothetical protein